MAVLASAPFSARAEAALRTSPVKHIIEARATHPDFVQPITLDISGGSVTFNERDQIHVTATLEIKVPDAETLALLDPRKRVQIEISTGYRYGPTSTEVHPFVRLDLRRRIIQRPADRVILEAHGYEARLLEGVVTTPVEYTSSSNAASVLQTRLNQYVGGSAAIFNTLPSVTFVESGDTLQEQPGDNPADLQFDIADRAAAKCYYDGLAWRICKDWETSGITSHYLSTGPSGTVTASESGLEREAFYNTILVRHTWTDAAGAEQTKYGYAYVSSGDFSVANVGTAAKVIDRNTPASSATATAAAVAGLKRGVSRGSVYSVEAASAAWWLRPGQTVQFSLKDGERDKALVTKVDFDLPTGTMHVTTRQPLDVEISTGTVLEPEDPLPAPPPETHTSAETAAKWHASYKGDGTAYSYQTDTYTYQGYYSASNGVFRGAIGAPDKMFEDLAAASSVAAIRIWLHASHWSAYAGGVAILGVHASSTAPGTAPGITGAHTVPSSGLWPRNAGMWITLPSSWYASFKSGAYRGITLHANNSTSSTYYGKFLNSATRWQWIYRTGE